MDFGIVKLINPNRKTELIFHFVESFLVVVDNNDFCRLYFYSAEVAIGYSVDIEQCTSSVFGSSFILFSQLIMDNIQ